MRLRRPAMRRSGVRAARRGSLNAMPVYTRHPVAAPPAAPARETTGHLMVRGYSVLCLFGIFAHTAVYNLFGPIGAVVVLAALSLCALRIWVPGVVKARP